MEYNVIGRIHIVKLIENFIKMEAIVDDIHYGLLISFMKAYNNEAVIYG